MANPMQLLDHGLIMTGGFLYKYSSSPLEKGYAQFELKCDGLGALATAKFQAYFPKTGKTTLEQIHKHTPRLLKVLPITLSFLVITSPLAISKAFVREAALIVLAATLAANFKTSKEVKPSHEGTVRILHGFALTILCKGTWLTFDNLLHGNLMGSAMSLAGMQLMAVLPFAVARYLQETSQEGAQRSERSEELDGDEVVDEHRPRDGESFAPDPSDYAALEGTPFAARSPAPKQVGSPMPAYPANAPSPAGAPRSPSGVYSAHRMPTDRILGGQ